MNNQGDQKARNDTEVVESASYAPSHQERELHIPLSSRAVFWQPRHVAASPALVRVPYLFWLVEAVQPERIVQIGLGDGIGFLALCQAVDKLNLDSSCLGVAAEPTQPVLPPDLLEQHASHYSDFSDILEEGPDRAARLVPEGSVDLMVVNGEMTDDLVTALRLHWHARLSERGVLVLLDPQEKCQSDTAREYVDRNAENCPFVQYRFGDVGIETYLIGAHQPDRLRRLAGMPAGSPGYLAARQVFARLGQGLLGTEQAKADRAAFEQARAQVDTLRTQLREMTAELSEQRGAQATAAQHSEQAALIATLQARLFEAEDTLRETRNQMVDASELTGLREDLAQEKRAREAAEARAKDLERRMDEADTAREAEIARLREQLSESQEKRKAFYERNQELQRQLTQAGDSHDAAMAKLNEELTAERQSREAADARVEELTAEKQALETTLEERLSDIVALSEGFEKRLAETETAHKGEIETLRDEKLRLERDLEARLADIAALTSDTEKRLADADAQAEQLRAQLEARFAEIAALTERLEQQEQTLKQFQKELDETRAHRDELLNSTSWKLTAPARMVLNSARGRRAPSESVD